MPKITFKRCNFLAGALSALILSAVFAQPVVAQAQDPGRSYADRQNPRLSKSGPVYMDPNVYAYTAEFANWKQVA
jgi:hypothetical protein